MTQKFNPRLHWLKINALKWDSDDCLMWPFLVDRDGYGRLNDEDGVETRSHRAAFFLKYGRWPNPCALHSCDTPGCCNLRHISQGTHQRNQHEKAERGRSLKGTQQHDAKLTDEIVRQARIEYATGNISLDSLAKRYGVTLVGMRFAIRGLNWKHIEGAVGRDAVRRCALKTHCKYGHLLSDDNLYVYGNQRQCKICTALRAKKRAA